MTRLLRLTVYSLTMAMLLIVLSLVSYSCSSTDEQSADIKVKAESLKADFTVLRKTLEEVHPGLYWYHNKVAMDRYFDSTYNLIDHDMTSVEFFKFLLPLHANIRCSHTSLRFSNDIKNRLQLGKLLPFNFFCRNGRIWITKDFDTTRLEGLEILSINNITTKEILETLLNTLPADGYNETFKYHVLSAGAFREGYALYFGQADSFAVETADTGNLKSYVFTVKAKTPQELFQTEEGSPKKPLGIKYIPHLNTALLELNTFQSNTKKFLDTLNTIFKAIKGHNSSGLIIDLRQNAGGTNDNVSTLFSFIASSPFLHLKRAEMNTPVFTYSQYVINIQNYNRLHGVRDASGKYLISDRYAGTSIQLPVNENLFKGRVVLLTSGNTTSAASEFAAIAHFTKRAEIVGEETGGCYYGATGGNFITLRLPKSSLEVKIPTIQIFTAVDEDNIRQPKGRGTLPDHNIVPTIRNVIDGKDVQLEAALHILGN